MNFQNIEQLHFSIYKIDYGHDFNQYGYKGHDSVVKHFFKTEQPIKEFTAKLPEKTDYFNHSTEIVIPKLQRGKYIILATQDSSKKTNKLFAYNYQTVSNLVCIESDYNGKKILQVLDRTSGEPIENAKVNFVKFTKYTNTIGEAIFSKDLDYQSFFKTKVTFDKDTIIFNGAKAYNYHNKLKNETKKQAFIFLDRSIYRPGQEVHFKGIILARKDYKTGVISEEVFKILIRDANYQELKSFELTTNEYGSFSEKFKLPKNILTGNFSIVIEPLQKKESNNFNRGHARFSVEEYKRPKFEVLFNPITESYLINQNICVKGNANALAGSTITNAKVTYSVVRKTQYSHWNRWNKYGQAQEITQGETTTNEVGEFTINFNSLPDLTSNKESLPIFNYEITANVTDLNGETRSATTNVKIGYHSMNLGITTSSKWNANTKNLININTTNLNNEFTPATITVQVYKLQAPNDVLRTRKWQAPDTPLLSEQKFKTLFPHEAYTNEDNITKWKKGTLVFEETIDTKNKTSIELNKLDWVSGNYILIAKGKDAFDIIIEQEKRFLLTNSEDTYLSDKSLFDFKILNSDTAKKDGFIRVKLLTADENVHVLSEAYFNNNNIYKEVIHVNGNKVFNIPLSFIHKKEAINPNSSVLLQFSLVRFNQYINRTASVSLAEIKEQLTIETKTFRNKLQPGAKEKWSFTVKNKKGVQAEVLASMYDVSLDQFKPHNWKSTIEINDYYYNTNPRKSTRSFYTRRFRLMNSQNKVNYDFNKQYSKLNYFGFLLKENKVIWDNYMLDNYYSLEDVSIDSNKAQLRNYNVHRGRKKYSSNANFKDANGSIITADSIGYDTLANGKVVANALPGQIAQVPVDDNETYLRTNFKNEFKAIAARKNLNETAFFYPHLKTNSKGDVSFEFETPEALTRWKVQLFGHTKTGVSGKFTQNVVTQKELMVIPNPPRFLREKDTIVFQSKIASLSDNPLNGFAKLELYDVISGKNITTQLLSLPMGEMLQSDREGIQSFKIDKKGNTSVSWKLVVPEGVQAVEYKVLAKAGTFTDGESNVLPVLTNNMLVTESIPITVRSNSSKTYSFNKLKNNTSTTLRNHQLTLEYTSNPAWYAIQSLPYLMEFPHECAEQTFSRYYANSIGSHILNSNPKIKNVFDSCKANGKLTSKLEQNEELKQLLISETPWLRDVQSDAEKKKRLGLLFDLEKLASEERTILKKLKQMQLPSGGFPWFSGGRENEYITRHIVSGFGHLQQLGIIDPSGKKDKIIEKAIAFLDTKFIENHNRKLKHQTIENITVGNYELHYLYTRSFFRNTVSFDKAVKPIVNIYINKTKNKWLDRTLLQKTMLSMVLHRFNDRQLPQLILEHLKETSIVDTEKGMYWKSNTSGWYWHEAPIETQALIIEAFSEITDDKNTIEELQIWLLNNKRKQDWNTTKATTEATYALLLQGNDWLSIEGSASFKVGDKKINTKKLNETKLEAGTGYFKTSWNTTEITPKMADISIKNTSEVTQFGGYYWQYFEQLDKITNEEHANDIQLHKELFLKKNTDNGPTLTKIGNTELHLGDLVTVRIKLEVKDNFEFVHLKDMRASAFEPVDVISKYKWQDGAGYYQSTKDVATHFFFDRLHKGTYILEYDVRVNNAGDFSNGISTIQSMYAPEFSSHSKGVRVSVEK